MNLFRRLVVAVERLAVIADTDQIERQYSTERERLSIQRQEEWNERIASQQRAIYELNARMASEQAKHIDRCDAAHRQWTERQAQETVQ